MSINSVSGKPSRREKKDKTDFSVTSALFPTNVMQMFGAANCRASSNHLLEATKGNDRPG
eukprot:scaffold247_cov172-Ochromonas_danica.AAC.6